MPDEYFAATKIFERCDFDIAVAQLSPAAISEIRNYADNSVTAVTPATLAEGSRLIITSYPDDKPYDTLWKCLRFYNICAHPQVTNDDMLMIDRV